MGRRETEEVPGTDILRCNLLGHYTLTRVSQLLWVLAPEGSFWLLFSATENHLYWELVPSILPMTVHCQWWIATWVKKSNFVVWRGGRSCVVLMVEPSPYVSDQGWLHFSFLSLSVAFSTPYLKGLYWGKASQSIPHSLSQMLLWKISPKKVIFHAVCRHSTIVLHLLSATGASVLLPPGFSISIVAQKTLRLMYHLWTENLKVKCGGINMVWVKFWLMGKRML